jgi:hypothetical protein
LSPTAWVNRSIVAARLSKVPRYLIEQDLREARLLPMTGRHFKGGRGELVAARQRNTPHGPVANRLWQFIADQAARIVPADT